MLLKEPAQEPDVSRAPEPDQPPILDEADPDGTLAETWLAEQEPEVAEVSRGEDPVRLYLKEIGKVRLLTAEQEVKIGQRIEAGQAELRRALGGIPHVVRSLLARAERARHQEVPLDDLIHLPEGK